MSSSDCPYWKRGYCVADKDCKLKHDPENGGQLQESYLSQINEPFRKVATARIPYQLPAPAPMGMMAPMGYYGVHAPVGVAAMASALYGGYYAAPAPIEEAPKNYKTQQCRHFLRGHCMRGTACGFLHEGDAVEGPIAPEYGQLPAELSNPLFPGRPFRTVTCKRWLSGHCGIGDRCTYKHEYDHLQTSEYAPKRSMSPEKRHECYKVQKTE